MLKQTALFASFVVREASESGTRSLHEQRFTGVESDASTQLAACFSILLNNQCF
jgi:hypothetical protein